MYGLYLANDSSHLILTGPDGEDQQFVPKTGTALELYDQLHDLARTDPAQVIARLSELADPRPDQPESEDPVPDADGDASQLDPHDFGPPRSSSDAGASDGVANRMGGPNPYSGWQFYGDLNNLSTESSHGVIRRALRRHAARGTVLDNRVRTRQE